MFLPNHIEVSYMSELPAKSTGKGIFIFGALAAVGAVAFFASGGYLLGAGAAVISLFSLKAGAAKKRAADTEISMMNGTGAPPEARNNGQEQVQQVGGDMTSARAAARGAFPSQVSGDVSMHRPQTPALSTQSMQRL